MIILPQGIKAEIFEVKHFLPVTRLQSCQPRYAMFDKFLVTRQTVNLVMNIRRIAAAKSRRQSMGMMATEVIIFQLFRRQGLLLGMYTLDKLQQVEV